MRRLVSAAIAGLLVAGIVLSAGELGCPDGFLLIDDLLDPWEARCLRVVDHSIEQLPARIVFT